MEVGNFNFLKGEKGDTGVFGFEQIDVQPNENNVAYDFNVDSEGFYRVPYYNTEEGRWENVPMRDFAKHLKPSNSAIVFGSTFSGQHLIPKIYHSVLLKHDCNITELVFLESHFDFERTIEIVNASSTMCNIRIVSEDENDTLKEFTLERADYLNDPYRTSPVSIQIQKLGDVYYENRNKQLTSTYFDSQDSLFSVETLLAQLDENGDNFFSFPIWYHEESRLIRVTGVDLAKAFERKYSLNSKIQYIENPIALPNSQQISVQVCRRFVVKDSYNQNLIIIEDLDFVSDPSLISKFQNVVLEFINLKANTISVMFGNPQSYQLAFVLNPSNNADPNQNKMNRFIFTGNQFVRIG